MNRLWNLTTSPICYLVDKYCVHFVCLYNGIGLNKSNFGEITNDLEWRALTFFVVF